MLRVLRKIFCRTRDKNYPVALVQLQSTALNIYFHNLLRIVKSYVLGG